MKYVEQLNREDRVNAESTAWPRVIQQRVDGLETKHDCLQRLDGGWTAHRLNTDTYRRT